MRPEYDSPYSEFQSNWNLLLIASYRPISNENKIWSHINLTNSGDVTTYDPGGETTKNGTEVTVNASVSGEDLSGSLGASAGISGTFVLSQDTVDRIPRSPARRPTSSPSVGMATTKGVRRSTVLWLSAGAPLTPGTSIGASTSTVTASNRSQSYKLNRHSTFFPKYLYLHKH